ncbi:hypothetical protein K439DRAFT_1643416 [Ramaria rubella]|nr:hypothetical protein K439DRAFT_1643416 [Ramaria rubella]
MGQQAAVTGTVEQSRTKWMELDRLVGGGRIVRLDWRLSMRMRLGRQGRRVGEWGMETLQGENLNGRLDGE